MATTANSILRAEPTPLFRRAKPQDAVDLAVATFVGGDRVDLQALATQLAVSRATLHRWFGSREQLLDRVCEQLAVRFTSTAAAAAEGDGDERVCVFCRRLMEAAVEYEPVRGFVAREPELALRLILGKDGAVHRVVSQALRSVIAETRPPRRAKPLEGRIDVIVQVATALVWATFVVGDAPQIDSAVEIIRMILAAG
jgi:AcrR family transcriptional regulator